MVVRQLQRPNSDNRGLTELFSKSKVRSPINARWLGNTIDPMRVKLVKGALAAAASMALIVSFGNAAVAANELANPGISNQVQKNVSPVRGQAGKPKPVANTGISYHSGPVMVNPITIYPIWYGNFSSGTASSTKDILTHFMSNIGGSPYYNITTTYTNGSGAKVKNQVTLSTKSVVDNYSLGTNLTDANIATLVNNAINGGTFPRDPDGFYLVLTAGDVGESSGFLTNYCGWHTYTSNNAVAIKYSFVGDATKGLGSCTAQSTNSPNGNPAADGMVSVIAHELEEAASDPQLNAWYDTRGYENADKCAWNFGTQSTATNGSKYNMTLGGKQYLVQQNWVNAGSGGCLMSY